MNHLLKILLIVVLAITTNRTLADNFEKEKHDAEQELIFTIDGRTCPEEPYCEPPRENEKEEQ